MKKLLLPIAFGLFMTLTSTAQTLLVNYNCNSATTYPISPDANAAGISGSLTSSESFQTYAGAATGSSAFTQNTTAGNAIAMANSSGTNTKYFILHLNGTSMNQYQGLQMYLQSQRSATGATTINIATSTDGTNYTAQGTSITVPTAFGESVVSLTGLNGAADVYIKLEASGASGTGTLRIDNLEIQGNISQNAWQSNGSNLYYSIGNIGVGTSNPNYNLDVAGSFRVSNLGGTGSRLVLTDVNGSVSPLSSGTSSQVLYGNNTWGALPTIPWTTSGSNVYYNSGSVGIGNNNPQTTLDVTGSGTFSGNLNIGGILAVPSLGGGNGGNLRVNSMGVISLQTTSTSWDLIGNGGTDEGALNFLGTTDDKDIVFKTFGNERMRITSHSTNNREAGRVIIGGSDLITPANDLPGNWDDKLIVKDAIRVVNDALSPSKCGLFGNDGANTFIESFSIDPPDQPGFGYSTSPDGILMGYYSGANVFVSSTVSTGGNLSVQHIMTADKIGVGGNPTARLSVMAPTTGDAFNITNSSSTLFSIGHDGSTNILDADAANQLNPVLMLTHSSGSTLKFMANGSGDISSSASLRPHFASGNDFSVYEGVPGSGSLRFKIDGTSGSVSIPALLASGITSTGPYQSLMVDANGKLVSHLQVPAGSAGLTWDLGGNTNTSSQAIGTLDANGDLPFLAGGSVRMQIFSDGSTMINSSSSTNSSFKVTNSTLPNNTGSAAQTPFEVDALGHVVIGTQRISSGPHSDAKLQVSGKIACQEVRVFTNATAAYWADYVFKDDYKLLPLQKVEDFYLKNKHLPGVPSANEIKEQGNDLAHTDAILLSKIEENTIYIVELNKKFEKLERENEELKRQIKKQLKK